MRAARRRAALLLCAALLAASLARAEGAPLVFAHRGGRGFPENSLAACRAALALGASCELDVRAARDGQLVLMHDRSVRRTTNGRGRVAALTLAQLRRLTLRGTSAERVPTLEEALALETGARPLLLDIKQDNAPVRAALARALARQARERAIWLGVRSEAQALALRALAPRASQVAFIRRPREIESFARAGVEAIRLHARWLSAEPRLAARVRSAGARLLVMLGNDDPRTRETALAASPDALLADDVVALFAALKRDSAKPPIP